MGGCVLREWRKELIPGSTCTMAQCTMRSGPSHTGATAAPSETTACAGIAAILALVKLCRDTFDAAEQHLYRNGGQHQSHEPLEGAHRALAEQPLQATGG